MLGNDGIAGIGTAGIARESDSDGSPGSPGSPGKAGSVGSAGTGAAGSANDNESGGKAQLLMATGKTWYWPETLLLREAQLLRLVRLRSHRHSKQCW